MIVWVLAVLIALVVPVSWLSASTAEERVELSQLSAELTLLISDVENISVSVGAATATASLSRLSVEFQFFLMRLNNTNRLRRVDDLEPFDYAARIRSLQSFYQAIERHLKKSNNLPVVFNYQKLIDDLSAERLALDEHLGQRFRQARKIHALETAHDGVH